MIASLTMRFVALILMGVLCGCGPKPQADEPVDPAREAIERGVAWLLEHQQSEGCFGGKSKGGELANFSAVETALALMALHDAGHRASDDSEEGRAMLRAIEFLCVAVKADSVLGLDGDYLGRSDRSRMYGQGIITAALATVSRDVENTQLKILAFTRVRGAVRLIIASQQVKKDERNQGGWRYEPQSSDSDISVTAWLLEALRAAADNVDVRVPKETWTSASSFIERCSKPATFGRVFSYEPNGGRQTFSTTAAGVLGLRACGAGGSQAAKGGLIYLEHSEIEPKEPWLYYGLARMSQAMSAAGGDSAASCESQVRKLILPLQEVDGCWLASNGNEKSAGLVYRTSLAISALAPWVTR